jgi:TetR/AcrR family transcriptional repressor of bet genes
MLKNAIALSNGFCLACTCMATGVPYWRYHRGQGWQRDGAGRDGRAKDGVAVPKRVDQDQRRRAIAEAVFAVIGDRGFGAVSLRDVASAAGVSMGSVQHYFATKDEMLAFTLQYLRERVLYRLQVELEAVTDPTPRQMVRTVLRMMLPVDDLGRQEARVNIAFLSAATVARNYADLLRDSYVQLRDITRDQLREAAADGQLAAGTDPDREAAALFFTARGLVGPVLIGLYTPADALALLDHQLARIFR